MKWPRAMGFRIATALAAVGVLLAGVGAVPAWAGTPARTEAIGTWGASTDKTGLAAAGQTVRNIVTTSTAGQGLQVTLSNVYSAVPVTFGAVTVAKVASGAGVVPGSGQQALFAGQLSVTIPAGAQVRSDPLPGVVAARQNLAVSIYLVGSVQRATGHALALTTSYLSTPGDHTGDVGGSAYTTPIASWLWLESLEVTQRVTESTVAALGDSITDGFASTVDANRRWTDVLATRLLVQPPTDRKGVLNEGISGNRVLRGGAGDSALARFDRDVLDQPGVETVILLEGINDINSNASAEAIIDGYRELIARAHADQTCILGGTLTPNENGGLQREAERQAVNDFIRTGGEFDGVIDFDAVVRDPDDPTLFLDRYDSGDGLHPSDEGYAAMGAAVPLTQLDCGR